MRKLLLFTGLIFWVTINLMGNAQECEVPHLFDADIDYSQEIYVSPMGNNSADGSKVSPLRSLQAAMERAQPGTKIILQPGQHQPGNFASNLVGLPTAPIMITGAEDGEPAIIGGGNTALQLTDPAYIVLQNFVVDDMSANGINIDDGGSYETPAHHVIIRDVTVSNVGPDGNRDAIKLSGLDHFHIEHCVIDSPGDGGSGIDMVGCHDGFIAYNRFQNVASSGVQAKGGTARVMIYANWFDGPAQRAINMGGSTGLEFFRPIDAPYEASHITVWANIFDSPITPVAFVGCQYGLFAHNIVITPRNWIARILQETVGERFVLSSNNIFANNIVVIDNQVNTLVNIGPNTDPESFHFAGNLIYHRDNPNFSNPNLPGSVRDNLIQEKPVFVDESAGNYDVAEDSPALFFGVTIETIDEELPIVVPNLGDYEGQCYTDTPTIGAYSGMPNEVRNWEMK